MRLLRSLTALPVPPGGETIEGGPGAAVAIGFFDGVHLGHQAILREVVARARSQSLASVALTFEDHPMRLFQPDQCPPFILTPPDKVAALEAVGLNMVLLVPFDRWLADHSAEDFCRRILREKLNMRTLVCGPDFAMGRQRLGTVPVLLRLGAQMEFEVDVVEPVMVEGMRISSTALRESIAEGDVESAAAAMNRPFALHGRVVAGRGLGRTIGVPTINIEPDSRQVLPANGVYAVRAQLDPGATRGQDAVLNIGHRPTVGGGERTVEFHVLGDVVGCPELVRLEFVKRLRDERRFESVDSLVAQIRNDMENARAVLRSAP